VKKAHDHRLLQLIAELLRDPARGDIGAAAGWVRYDELDWLVG
jgi:hypothetical protein